MNQTICHFGMATSTTNHTVDSNTVMHATTGCAKRGFTVALCALASGEKKPAFICFKERSGTIPTGISQSLRVPDNVRLTASKNGWMTGPIMGAWISSVWGPTCDNVRRLLILDKTRIHTMAQTSDQLAEKETDLIFVPGNY